MIRMVRNVEIPPDLVTKTLRKGDAGAAVRVLQELLKSAGFTSSGPTDGQFGDRTWAAVLTFQQSANLTVDGVVGPATWAVLAAASPGPWAIDLTPVGSPRAQELLGIAIGELGEVEVPDGSNGGPRIDVYTGRWRVPWCALFAGWCLRETEWGRRLWPQPISAVVNVRAWALEQKVYEAAKAYAPQSGDLFVLLQTGQAGVDAGHGHVGFVVAYDARAKTYRTVEGNASNGVRSNVRKRADADGFVRIVAA